MNNLSVDGRDVKVTRKKIKNMYLYVKPPDGRVEVSAPLRMPDARIREFVRARAAWIAENSEKIRRRSDLQKKAYLDGEIFYVWGEPVVLALETGTRNSVRLMAGRMILTVREGSTQEIRGKIILEWYRGILRTRIQELLPRVEKYSGLHCSSWQIRNMKTRWGTCNTATDKIWLNLQLAAKPPVCLEYVILHELAHTVIKNHGPEFKALLNVYMPEWKKVRRELNESVAMRV